MRSAGRALIFVCTLVLAGGALVAVTAASGGIVSTGKPVIGKPVATPAQPQAGKPFSISFKVTRGGAPLTSGAMTLAPTIDGKPVAHTGSFRGGVARGRLVVPGDAAGKTLKVTVTISAAGTSATRSASFHVRGAATPSVSIGDASVPEGNSGTTALSFAVTLSSASSQAVSVHYATSDGSATAPSDYASASGTLTFAPGAKSETITVSVVGDLNMEPDETLTVTLSSPSNAVLGKATATGTIKNDDTAAPITAGSYKGATQEGNFVFLTVQGDRSVTGFSANSLSLACDQGGEISGSVNFGTRTFPVGSDGSFLAQYTWSGSQKDGDLELTNESWKVTGTFSNPTTIAGTINFHLEVNYQGTHFSCTTNVTYTATFQG